MPENTQWLMITKLRELIALARSYDIDINELTVNASQYDQLMHDAAVTCKFYDTHATEYALRIHNVVINKRACKGCCRHD